MAIGDFDVNRIVGERNALKGLLDESLRRESTLRAENAALREEVKAIKADRWAGFTDDDLSDPAWLRKSIAQEQARRMFARREAEMDG